MTTTTDTILLEMLRFIRASSYPAIQQIVEREFVKSGQLDQKRATIYQLSNGTSTSVAIAKAAGVSQSFVSTQWKRWRQMGLAEPAGEGGRQTRRCFSLDDFGLIPSKLTEGDDTDG
jgi:hypothetical protein